MHSCHSFKNLSSNYLGTFSILTVFLLLFAKSLFSQYHPFPVDEGKWINKQRNYYLDQNNFPVYSTAWIDTYCANGNDTIINATTYKQVDFCATASPNYHGAWRYTDGQVYFIPKDSLSEYLLYDFSLSTGSNVNVLMQHYSGSAPSYEITQTVIVDVDTIIVNGSPRRRLFTDGHTWIEGIGCTSGLFMEPWMNVSNYFRDLICMSKSDTVHYYQGPLSTGTSGTCDISMSTESLEFNQLKIQAFPNPTTGKITVQLSENISTVNLRLTNMYGQEIAHYNLTNSDLIELELNEDSGVYFIEILSSSGEKSTFMVVKQ